MLVQLGNRTARLTLAASSALLIAATAAGPASAAQTGPNQAPQGLVQVVPAPPLPQGPLSPSTPNVPERFAEPIGPFTMFMEVLASAAPSQAGLVASPGCVTDSVYKRGMRLIFRFEVYDMDNRVRVTSTDGSSAEVQLPDGSTLPARFAPRGGPGSDPSTAPWTWVAVWQIPTDYPLGPVLYSVNVATADGRAGSIDPPSIAGQPVVPGAPLMVARTFPTIIP